MADSNSKQTPIPVIPRTMKIVNPDGTVTRSGQLLLEQLQTPVATTGSHWTRPDAGSVQDGAIYVESDRSVIYVNEGGEWHYLAGTMWGTLNPDQRPSDLGVNDAGFDFRTTDTDPVYAPREFIWSGSLWVEATPVNYGSHFDRPPADSQTPPRTIYVESDRSGVIYQQQANEWHYLAGTMYGTISPDERPTDLGVNDAGFEFRSTDTDPLLGGHDWIWSGSDWVEVTPARYGGHATRLAQPLPETWNGMLWVETDRSGVIYQNQSGVWHFLAGTMWGTLVPDQRPTDLGVNDAGFHFRSTDTPPREFIWSGTAWAEVSNGAASLTHPNVVTKVGPSPGQIVEGGITDLSAANSGVMVITAGGQVGIGVPTPQMHLEVNGSGWFKGTENSAGEGIRVSYDTGSRQGDILAYDFSSGFRPLSLRGSQIYLTGGNVSIGTGGVPTHLLELSADSAAKPATSTWTVFSDVRLKQNVEPVEDDSLGILANLDWIRYEHNGKANTPDGLKGIGLSAQELQKHLPEAVRSAKTKLNKTDDAEVDVLSIDYHHILVHSARAIQQLNAEVKALKALIGQPQ